MMPWQVILSQPIVQICGLIGSLVALQRSGLNVIGAVQSFFGIEPKEAIHDNRNVMQAILTQMEVLSLHFNHETTENQDKILGKLEEMLDIMKENSHELRTIREFGVKTLK